MNILELLYDHYKDTCEKLEKQIHQRNKNFAFSFLITCVLLLFAINPAEYRDLMFEYIRTEFSIDLSSQFFVIQTLLWAVLLYETMRYSQVFANIERTYDYINALEIRYQIYLASNLIEKVGIIPHTSLYLYDMLTMFISLSFLPSH